jgi:hypothetical protein
MIGPQNDGTFKIVAGIYGGVQLGWTGTSWGSASDIRLKEDIISLTNCLSKITSLNPVSFYYINRPSNINKKTLGLIAQEVISVIPEVTGTYTDSTTDNIYYNITYTELIPVLIGAIKEQTTQIQQQTTQLATQESKVASLESQLNQLLTWAKSQGFSQHF